MSIQNRLSAEDLAAVPASALLLDVRTPAEYETAHIPGSINVPLSLIENHAEEIAADIPQEAVIICRSGARAARAQQMLAATGLLDTGVLEGGIQAWNAAGKPVSQGPARWDLERQVRLVAGSIVAGGVALSTVTPKAKWVSGAIGSGLVYAAVSNSCMMGNLLSKLPYNRTGDVTLAEAKRRLKAQSA